jgi:hypothetical protein
MLSILSPLSARAITAGTFLTLVVVAYRPVWAIQAGTTHPAARQDALKTIPLDKLQPPAREKVLSVLNDTCFFRRLPICVFRCDPELYLFLVKHPDVIVGIWRLMGLTEMEMERLSPERLRFHDGQGTRGTIEYLYASHDTHVIFTDAAYEGPLLARPVRSRGVIVLRSGYVLETDGQYYVTSRLDLFLSVDRATWEAITKTLHPLVGKIADANFSQTAQFVSMLYQMACENPETMRRLPTRLTGIQQPVREEFSLLLTKIEKRTKTQNMDTAPTVAEKPPTVLRR